MDAYLALLAFRLADHARILETQRTQRAQRTAIFMSADQIAMSSFENLLSKHIRLLTFLSNAGV
jgi:hypothetical protein